MLELSTAARFTARLTASGGDNHSQVGERMHPLSTSTPVTGPSLPTLSRAASFFFSAAEMIYNRDAANCPLNSFIHMPADCLLQASQ